MEKYLIYVSSNHQSTFITSFVYFSRFIEYLPKYNLHVHVISAYILPHYPFGSQN